LRAWRQRDVRSAFRRQKRQVSAGDRFLYWLSPHQKHAASGADDLFRELCFQLPPFWGPLVDGRSADGPLAELLQKVSDYVNLTVSSLEAPAGNQRPDRGGNSNAFRLLSSSPAWTLIDMCWRLLEKAPHCPPTGTVNGPLHRFVLAMHEWITGEDRSGSTHFEYHLKRYAPIKREAKELLARLNGWRRLQERRG
jgi:hypothetical protein